MKAGVPKNEKGRLEALAQYEILDTLPEGEFDEITQVAAHICGCPIATISLIEDQRQWYKSRVGMDMTETPRDISFCAHTITDDKLLVVEDATKDVRFADNPVVTGGPAVRFYAGMPLTNKDGFALGTLCVVDLKPRSLSPEQEIALQALSRHVVTHLDLRKALIDRRKAEEEVRRLNESLESRVVERTNELQVANAELKIANQAKTEFLTNMSHEIRTPLNAIIGMSDLMMGTAVNAEQKDFLGTIQANGSNLLSIVNDVLDLSKIEFGKMEMENAPFNLAQLVEEVIVMFRFRAEQKNLILSSRIDPALSAEYVGDIARIRQVLVNLVSNAVKFTGRGAVQVEVAPVASSGNAMPGRLLFSVRDTGIGIKPEELGRLFKVFSQVDASVTRAYGGSGLGLAICKKLTELMGGTIRVESHAGQGSVFSFELALSHSTKMEKPAPAQTVAPLVQAMPEAALARALRILVVEDNLTNQKVVRSILKRIGYEADIANQGLEAVAAVEAKEYDLILMDLHMPGMDGLEATQRIRRMQMGKHPRIVALTADVLKGTPEKCLEMGMNSYVSKPLKIDVLKTIIDAVFAFHDGLARPLEARA